MNVDDKYYWLSVEQLGQYIGEELAESFPFQKKIIPKVDIVIKEWLVDLIGQARIDTLAAKLQAPATEENPDPLTADDQAWLDLIRPFLALAAWSNYVGNGNVTYTATGPVTKTESKSDPIEGDQRADISRSFLNRAKTWAVRLAKKAAETNLCTSSRAGSGRVSATVIRSKNTSYFDDFRS